MTETSPDCYARAFGKFLAHIDQVEVFAGEFNGYIELHRPASLLDIGAGNGVLAAQLSRRVEKYVAVERNPTYAGRLRDFGIDVIEGSFPLPLADTYDLVVMSYVVSYEDADRHQLISAAWDRVTPGGHLLVVLHRGGMDSDWGRLLAHIGMERFVRHQAAAFHETVSALDGMGAVEARDVLTTVAADNMQDMLEVLAFVVPSGHHQEFLSHRAEVTSVLDRNYSAARGYAFPFRNTLIRVGPQAGSA